MSTENHSKDFGGVSPKIEFRNVSKRYGACIANEDVSFTVMPGTIHAILGENGAGKSTAMKLLYGMAPHDSGQILIDGREVFMKNPQDAIARGIGMIHQHFMLSERDSALDNLILGSEPWSLPKGIERKAALGIFEELCKKHGLKVSYTDKIEKMSVGERQRIEILKAVYRKSEVLILDEPTAVLAPSEIEFLFDYLKTLKKQGKTILIITHKLKEVLKHTDAVTVLRAGRTSANFPCDGLDFNTLARAMIGREWKQVSTQKITQSEDAPVLTVKGLCIKRPGKSVLKDVSFSVFPRQVVGIAGVEGNGQSELLRALTQNLREGEWAEGAIHLLSKEVTAKAAPLTTSEILRLGVSYVPEDRHEQGLIMDATLEENLLLGQLERYSWYGFLRPKWIRSTAERLLESYDIRPRDPHALARSLSGGNQQKLIFARELERSPKLFIIAQPTRGVDLGAIQTIHERILEAKNQGAGILLISSELDEILTLSDDVYVMSGGSIVGHHVRESLNMDALSKQMGGVHA